MIFTRPFLLLGGLGLLFCQALPAAYSNPISTGDGNTVYFQVKTGFGDPVWYFIRSGSTRAADQRVADIDAGGTVMATASYGQRYCGTSGSTCFVAPPCAASFAIQGPGVNVSNSRRPTTVRLDREGRRAWIDQKGECRGFDPAPPPPLNGLYELPSLRLLAPANNAVLANPRYGRRLITSAGQALTFAGLQLQLLDAGGARPLRHTAGALEAVVDAAGAVVVYTEEASGTLHWIDVARNADEDLGIAGSAPALSDDGRLLLFIGKTGALELYDRGAGVARRLLAGVAEFTIAGNGQTAFAVTGENRLVRLDLPRGETAILLEPLPEITSMAAPPAPLYLTCPLYCYGTPNQPYLLGRGSLVAVAGRFLDQPGWRVRTGGIETPLRTITAEGAWFLVPVAATGGAGNLQPVEIFHPDHPLRFTFQALLQDRTVTCFGTLHQDFSRLVTARDPAVPGEFVHVFLTGLRGAPPVNEGVPNPTDRLIPVADPPALGGEGAVEPVFFGLAPGFIALQQLDLRVVRPAAPVYPEGPLPPLFPDVAAQGCELPPVRP